ncbi:MAG: PQQ-binding-like beta-propeller repeat protein [Planctomycetota bacterium]
MKRSLSGRNASWVRVVLALVAVPASAMLIQPNSAAGDSGFQAGANQVVGAELPLAWSPTENIAWTATIVGYGQSTPVVAHDLMVVTSTSGPKKETYHVVAIDPDDGQPRWQLDVDNPSPFDSTPMVSRAAPSAVATEFGFCAFFEGGLVMGVDTEGHQTWQRDLVSEFGPVDARHGLAASLESDGQRVYVWVERSESPYVLCLKPDSGETIWKVEGVGATAWASPRLIDVASSQHLVCSAIGKVIGLDPLTGKRLWEFDDIANNSSCTPMPVGDGRFLIGASDGRNAASSGEAAANNGLIQIQPQGDQFEVDYAWRAEKATSTFGSPVVAGSTAAFVNRTGVLYRLDMETGQQLSVARTDAGGIWATPLVTSEYIYLMGYKGVTAVVRLSDGEQVAANRAWPSADESAGFGGGHTLYAGIAVGDRLILRRGDMLFAIGEKTP